MRNKSIITPGLFNGFGGPLKTIKSFSDALDANIYSFCDGIRIKNENLDIGRSVPIPSLKSPILRQFLVPSLDSRNQLSKLLKDNIAITCHLFYRYHSLWVNRHCQKYSIPYFFVPHGILDPWVFTYRKWSKHLFWLCGGRRFLDQASTVIFATKAERDKAQDQFHLPAAEVCPWPVLPIDLSNKKTTRHLVRKHIGIPEDAKVLIYFGRLHSMKRPLHTIQALAGVRESNLHLVILGNENDITLDDCRTTAQKLGILNRVHLIGPVYGIKKYDYLFASDAYISLSWRENFNHAAAEALAAGLPVILSPGNDLNSEIGDANCTWTLTNDELNNAVQAIQNFYWTKSSIVKEMGLRGRSWVIKHCNFEKFSYQLNSIIEKYL